jgi:hypothetical protein
MDDAVSPFAGEQIARSATLLAGCTQDLVRTLARDPAERVGRQVDMRRLVQTGA